MKKGNPVASVRGCILLALLFFIAFTSYLFTWDEDQDMVFKDGYKLLTCLFTTIKKVNQT